MTEQLQNADAVIKARLGIENSPYKKTIHIEGDLSLQVWRFFQPETILEAKIHTVVFVFNTKDNKVPFIELYKDEFNNETIPRIVDKFKENPLSFNNQKNG